ncbi:hypothetical protein D3C87_2188090 [compost metagenome]
MKRIDGPFVADPEHDHQAASHSQREAKDINSRKRFAFEQVTESDFEIIVDHGRAE